MSTRLASVVAALALCVTFSGASYAADKLALTCSGSVSRNDKIPLRDDDGTYSFVVDLDRNVVGFGYSISTGAGDNIPITKVTDNYIQFGNQALSNPYWEGELDRYTGSLHLFHRSRLGGDTENYYLDCKPAKPLF
jgi:hypothetical protein